MALFKKYVTGGPKYNPRVYMQGVTQHLHNIQSSVTFSV